MLGSPSPVLLQLGSCRAVSISERSDPATSFATDLQRDLRPLLVPLGRLLLRRSAAASVALRTASLARSTVSPKPSRTEAFTSSLASPISLRSPRVGGSINAKAAPRAMAMRAGDERVLLNEAACGLVSTTHSRRDLTHRMGRPLLRSASSRKRRAAATLHNTCHTFDSMRQRFRSMPHLGGYRRGGILARSPIRRPRRPLASALRLSVTSASVRVSNCMPPMLLLLPLLGAPCP